MHLSEKYFQHSDHFTRVLGDKENQRKNFKNNQLSENEDSLTEKKINNIEEKDKEIDQVDKIQS